MLTTVTCCNDLLYRSMYYMAGTGRANVVVYTSTKTTRLKVPNKESCAYQSQS